MSQRDRQQSERTIKPGPVFDKSRCQEIRAELQQRLAAGESELLFDLHGITELSPSAIYLLLATSHTLAAAGSGRLALVNPNDDIRQILRDLHLDGQLGLDG